MRAVVFTCVLAGCFTPSPQAGAPCASNGDCPDGLECNANNKCEKPGAPSDSGPEADACTTGICEGDMLIGCGSAPVTCAHGCGGPVAHCRQLVPSNGLTTDMLVGATADITLDKLNFNADNGEIRMMNNIIREAGEGVKSGIRFEVIQGVAVWVANTWMLPAGDNWTFEGSKPVTLYAAQSITINGNIDVGAGLSGAGGPGGSNRNASTSTGGCRGKAGRSIDATHGEGGGGGGGAGAGANGAASNQGGTFTGIGGTSCTTNPSTIPLLGGNGGGDGGQSASNFGGGGGGAISLVAMDTVTITGDVGAPGGGGGSLTSGNGGGGGGSGGAVFVEAPTVSIPGRLTANGGGGGAPSGGADGARGSMTSATPASGGLYSGTGGPARGGNGGAGGTSPTVGAAYNMNVTDPVTMVTTNTNRGGGGGGAAGRIEVKRKTGGVSGLASPAATISNADFE